MVFREKSILKFFLSLVLHLFCYVATLIFMVYFIKQIGHKENTWNLYVGVTLLSIANFIILWRKLYSKEYHFYLSQSPAIISKYLPGLVSVCLVLELVITNFYNSIQGLPSELFIHIFTKYLLFVFFQYVFFKIQNLWIVYLVKLGFFRKNTMFAGNIEKRMYLKNLFQDINWTKNYIGQISKDEGAWTYNSFSKNFRGLDIDNIESFLHKKKVNELIICIDSNLSKEDVNRLITYCRGNSIGYYLIQNVNLKNSKNLWSNQYSDIPILDRYSPNRDSLIMISLKRLFDLIVSFFALVILSPVYLVISIAIVLVDGFPVIYTSKRVGIHGQIIRFYKFRTMVKNAEALKTDLMSLNERPDGPLFKMTEDPRVTSVGRILRKYSLDELPQFWNVLRGDMSLIGPRPHLPEEVLDYEPIDCLRLECVPGISCLPQIKGRDDLGFREWVDLDLEYRKNWSFKYDFWIMWETVKVVMSPLFRKNKKDLYEVDFEEKKEYSVEIVDEEVMGY